MVPIPQSTSFVAVFKAFLSSDHLTEATGKTIAITISKAGGAFGNPNAGATNATEISSGWYKVTLDTTDTGTLGIVAIRGTAATIDDYGDRFFVVSATTGGLTNLDAAITSRLAPTVAARTLDVSAGGEAGLDWANVGSPTTAVDLSGTTIKTTQKVDVDTIKTNPVVNGGTITFPTTATLASTTNITAGTITTASNLTTNNDKTGYALTAAYDLAKTAAQAGDAMALTAGERNSTADALLNRDMSTGTDSGSTTVRTVRQALRFLRNKWSIAGGTLTVTKEDDTTSSWTSAITTTAGDPVSASDPAGP